MRHSPDSSEDVRCLITIQPLSLLTQTNAFSTPSLTSSFQQSNVPAGTVIRSLPVTRRSSGVNAGTRSRYTSQLMLYTLPCQPRASGRD